MIDPHLLERGAFEVIDHPGGTGKLTHPKQMAAIFSKSPKFTPKAAPTLGQDNEYVLTTLLEMSQEDISELEKEGIIGKTPSKFVPGKDRPIPLDIMVKEDAARLEPDHLEQLSSAYHEKTDPVSLYPSRSYYLPVLLYSSRGWFLKSSSESRF